MHPFTPEEDMEIWKFVIKDDGGSTKRSSRWKRFVEQTNLQRTAKQCYSRFHQRLVSFLPFSRFHTETKLRICVEYKVLVDQIFLEALRKDAIVELNHKNHVNFYKMKSTAPPNRDTALTDEEFFDRANTIVTKYVKFTEEENAEIWEYVAANCHVEHAGNMQFWQEFVQLQNTKRAWDSVARRFTAFLAPELHETDFDMETKMRIYKAFKISVNPGFLETIKKHYSVWMQDGFIRWYKLIGTDQAGEKRKNSSEGDYVTKRVRSAGGSARAVRNCRPPEVADMALGCRQPSSSVQKQSSVDYEQEIREPTESAFLAKVQTMQNAMADSLQKLTSDMTEKSQEISNMMATSPPNCTGCAKTYQAEVPNRNELLLTLKLYLRALSYPNLDDMVQLIDTAIGKIPKNDAILVAPDTMRDIVSSTIRLLQVDDSHNQ